MDIEKLIERLKDYRFNWMLDLEIDVGKCTNDCADAATAFSAQQAENEKLQAELKEAEKKIDNLLDEEDKVAFYPFGVEKED